MNNIALQKTIITILLAFLLIAGKAFSQAPPTEFLQGMQLVTKNPDAAKRLLYIAASKAPGFYGSYHFLGILYISENKTDSAIFYLKKSITLNSANLNRTKELTYARLMDVYLQQHDFNATYQVAHTALTEIPNSPVVTAALKDASLWAFFIKDDGLDAKYLAHDIKPEYVVTSIVQEYLISRNLRLNDETLTVAAQALTKKDGADYDVLNCLTATSKQSVQLFFKLNWDMGKEFGGKMVATQPIINGKQYSPLERLGALFATNGRLDMASAIEQLGLN